MFDKVEENPSVENALEVKKLFIGKCKALIAFGVGSP